MQLHTLTGSSQIARYGYEPDTQTMAVEFVRGGLYHYFEVPPEVFEGFIAASSKGSYHHRNIKGAYRYERQ